MRRHTWLRGAVLGLLVAAVLDPGCDERRLVPLAIDAAEDVSSETVERVRRAVAGTGREATTDGAGPHALRIGVGSPRGLLTAHAVQPLAVAVRTADVGVHVSDLVVPRTMVAGMASVVRVRTAGTGGDGETLSVVHVRDAVTGQQIGLGQPSGADDRGAWVEIGVLPVTAGRWSLCITVAAQRDLDRPDDCEYAEVWVQPAAVRVDIFDARPSWAGRFTRLALQGWDRAVVTSTVRVASGIQVATRGSSAQPAPDTIEVTVVGGLDALESGDAARLAAAARDDGRVIVLLADGPVDIGRLRPLWPYAMRQVVTAAAPVQVRLGTHAWRTREWLADTPTATDVEVLAYLDASPAVPVVLSRALGHGRVVLVAALDAWKWRLANDVSFNAAWQALVLSLAADARQAFEPDAWRVPGPLADEVHVALPGLRDAREQARDDAATLRLVNSGATPFAADPAGGARAVDFTPVSASHVEGLVETPGPQGAGSRAIDLGRASTVPATWDDVRRRLDADGGVLVDEAGLRTAIEGLPVTRLPDGTRWFLTRQWWFAALVVLGLGLEWWWRRQARLP